MATTKRGAPHGFYRAWAYKPNAQGVGMGIAGSTLAAGSNSNPLMLDDPKTGGVSIPTPTTIDFTGGDIYRGSFQYGVSNLSPFDMAFQDRNSDMIALATGTTADQATNDEWTLSTEDVLNEARPQLGLNIIHRIQSSEVATLGNTFYVNTFIPRAWVMPMGYSSSYQTAAEYSYNVQPTAAARLSNGILVSQAGMNATNDKVTHYHIISEYPLWMATYVCDDATATVVGDYQPISTTVGTTTSTKNYVVKFTPSTGVAVIGVADTITQASGTFAIGTALTVASGDIVTVLYETDFTATTA